MSGVKIQVRDRYPTNESAINMIKFIALANKKCYNYRCVLSIKSSVESDCIYERIKI